LVVHPPGVNLREQFDVAAAILLGLIKRIVGAFVLADGGVLAGLGAAGIVRALPRKPGHGVGIAAHGIGTARALTVNETAGAYAALGMALNGLVTAILVPLLLYLFL